MRANRISAVAGTLAAAAVVLTLAARSPAAPKVDYRELAHRLVSGTAQVHAGDMVLVAGGVRDAELLEDVAVEVAKVGGHPLIVLGSDRLDRMLYDDVPPKYDATSSAFPMKYAGFVNAIIAVDYGDNPGALAGVPPARIAAQTKAGARVMALLNKRGVRRVLLGNDLYPTAARATQFGVSQDQLADAFWSGVNVDYAALRKSGVAIRRVLATGRQAHITNPNGTDLTVSIKSRPVKVTNGAISDADVRKGGAAPIVWLPAGEAIVAPVAGSARGVVVVDHYFFQGKPIEGLRLEFKAGRLTAMTAQSGLEPLKALYDAAAKGRDAFGAVDIGFNPAVHLVPGSKMAAWMPAGMVTVAVGNNTWAGGSNSVNFGMAPFLPGSTLNIDGKVLVDGGVLKLDLPAK